jgi:hypothetical protein
MAPEPQDGNPTLNEEYNKVYAQWRKDGFRGAPQCEMCGANLVGKNVTEASGFGWVCDDCGDDLITVDDDEDEWGDRPGELHESAADYYTRRAESGWRE